MSCFVDLPYSCLRCDQGESSRERWSSVGRVSSLGTQGTTGQTHSYFGFVLLLFSVWRAPVPEDPLRDFPCAPSGQARSFLECLSQAALPPELRATITTLVKVELFGKSKIRHKLKS
jgi:hypothetical protein